MVRVEHSICSPDIRMAHAELGDSIVDNGGLIWFSLNYKYSNPKEGFHNLETASRGALIGGTISSYFDPGKILRPQWSQFGEFWSGTSPKETVILMEAPPVIERPTEVFSERATDIVRREALSTTVEEILSVLRSSFHNLKRINIDIEDDPESEDGKWFSITLRLTGEIGGILESEREARHELRVKLRPEEYERFALSYDIVD